MAGLEPLGLPYHLADARVCWAEALLTEDTPADAVDLLASEGGRHFRVRTPRLEIGRQAAACLNDQGPKKLDLGFELIEGATA